jgi:hypothetical protein
VLSSLQRMWLCAGFVASLWGVSQQFAAHPNCTRRHAGDEGPEHPREADLTSGWIGGGEGLYAPQVVAHIPPALELSPLRGIRVVYSKQPEIEPVEIAMHRAESMRRLRKNVLFVRVKDQLHWCFLLPPQDILQAVEARGSKLVHCWNIRRRRQQRWG